LLLDIWKDKNIKDENSGGFLQEAESWMVKNYDGNKIGAFEILCWTKYVEYHRQNKTPVNQY